MKTGDSAIIIDKECRPQKLYAEGIIEKLVRDPKSNETALHLRIPKRGKSVLLRTVSLKSRRHAERAIRKGDGGRRFSQDELREVREAFRDALRRQGKNRP